MDIKIGDYFLSNTTGDIEQIVKIENNKYYLKTVKGVNDIFFTGKTWYHIKTIKYFLYIRNWKKVSNLQVKILTGEIDA